MTAAGRTVPAVDRISARISVDANGCWVYPSLNENGYGIIGEGLRGGRKVRTHRVMFEAFRGEIPVGLVLDHLCRNRACCNPDHLDPVTPGVNVLRGVRKTEQTTCKHGHPFTPDNTRVTARQRVCKACAKRRSDAYLSRRRHEITNERATA